MKTVEWTGADDKLLPDVGLSKRGEKFTMPDGVADSYIGQGLARIPKTKPVEEKANDSLRSKE